MLHFYKTGRKNPGRRENRVHSEEQIAERLYEELQAVARVESGRISPAVEDEIKLSKRLRDNMGMYLI